ncbi:MAG: SDR family oxidoreductase [Actinobacteria bacterium]|nr:SDR family oxidoreductase [Actinomycetota bacterium]
MVLTGAANGIGAATARRLLDAGATVATLDRDGDTLDHLARQLGPAFRPVTGDVRDPEALRRTVAAIGGSVDGLVVNAAHADLAPVIGGDADEAEEMIEINLLGAWRTLREVVPALRRPGGRVVLVTSTSVAVTPQLYGPYAASKAGLEGLANAFTIEVRPHGISVGLLTLHSVDTPTYQRVIGDERLQPMVDRLPPVAFRAMSASDAARAVIRALASNRRRTFAPWWAALPLLSPVLTQAGFDAVGRLTGATRLPAGAAAIPDPVPADDRSATAS